MTALRYSLWLIVIWAGTWTGAAQQAQRLFFTDHIRVDEQQDKGLAIVEPMKCSPEGELYLRFARGVPEPGVSIVSLNGKLHRRSLASIPELSDSSFLDYTPGPGGSASLLVGRRKNPRSDGDFYVVTLRDSGNVITKIDTQPGLALRQIAAFGAGSFAVAGFLKGPDNRAEPLLEIIDSNGRVQTQVSLVGDLGAKEVAQSHLIADSKDSPAEAYAGWLEVSSLQTADDGRVYLMRRSPEGPVFLITAGGAIQKLMLKTPERHAVLSSVKLNHGILAAEYYLPSFSSSTPRTYYLTLTDVVTGHQMQKIRYQSGQNIGVGMACYTDKGFEFLSQDSEGYPQIGFAVGN